MSELSMPPPQRLDTELGHPISFTRAVTVPFRDPWLVVKCWWIPLVSLIPIFNFPILGAWKVHLAKRVAEGHKNVLPESKKFPEFVGLGIWMYIARAIYFIPLFVALVFVGRGIWSNVQLLLQVLYQYFFSHSSTANIWWTLSQLVLEILGGAILPIFYTFALWPVF